MKGDKNGRNKERKPKKKKRTAGVEELKTEGRGKTTSKRGRTTRALRREEQKHGGRSK